MKTRTHFKLFGKSLVYCWCGSLRDFVEDIDEFILPILEDNIFAKFNDTQIVVYAYDNVNSIHKRFWEALNRK